MCARLLVLGALVEVLSMSSRSPAQTTAATGGGRETVENSAFKLSVEQEVGCQPRIVLRDKSSGLAVADGPGSYRATTEGKAPRTFCTLEAATLSAEGRTITIRGRVAGLELRQTFTLPADKPILEERIALTNPTDAVIALAEFRVALHRRVADSSSAVLPELAEDRWVAVPLRIRATDPPDFANDFSIHDLLTKPGYEPRMDGNHQYSQVPSPPRRSEGWAWTHGEHTLGIFAFCQEHMLFSVVTPETTPASKVLLFGGACMLGGEPAALTRIAAGQTIELGFTRYQTVRGGFTEAAHAFRALLDERGCRFPADYNPPVHWEQLYDMSGAWNDRPNQYTRAVLEKEAAKGRAFSCEALYLDPGWDTDFGTFLWGEAWLGPQRDFARLIEAQYGLKLALHCPLATWMSHPVVSWGIGAVRSWPKAAARMAPPGGPELRVPAMRDGRRNLALAPSAKPATSSVYQDGALPIHQTAHLNDGWYGNTASWIAGRLPAWAEIDLGSEQRISRVVLSNDHLRQYSDRTITSLRVLVAMEYAADSAAPAWREVAQYRGEGFQSEEVLDFPPAEARWVRIDIPAGSAKTLEDVPRLDEIEVYEAAPAAEADARGFEQAARRGPAPATTAGSQICLASKQYLDEAERRLLACCAAGAIFLMFDGNGWNGGCLNPDHGHPVPYRMEDHARANLDLVQRIHAKYPRVLIELHDPIAGPNMARYVPVYYKYGLPGSFDENWAFELMWNPIDDLRAGRARSLYYYALGCNVPAYLHIDLRTDNAECIVLWWYASTCRHLGIGGTHPTPAVVEAQKQAMRLYRQWDRFFKRGEFHGLAEDVHFHVLPAENAFVVNVFNLSDEPATRTASIDLRKLGLDPQRTYAGSQDWGRVRDGRFELTITLPPWSARVARFGPADDTRKGG